MLQEAVQYTNVCVQNGSQHELKEFHVRLQELYNQKYYTPYGCLWSCADEHMIQDILCEVRLKQELNPITVFVIGIGGSYLGTKAVYEALRNTPHMQVPLIFIDTFDVYDLRNAVRIIEQSAQSQKNVLIICVTKSGTTTETIVNFQIIIDAMQKNYSDQWHELVVIISDQLSSLTTWAHEHSCLALPIPPTVGGRFSVFTAVGLFPLALAGVDITQLCAGAREYQEKILQNDTNTSMKSARFVYEQYQKGTFIYDLFLFDKRLESVGKWYRQLLAESIGKERQDGIKVTLVPTVSIGTLELHSVAQLMLGAQPPMVTTFITVQSVKDDIAIVKSDNLLVKNTQNTTVHRLMNHAAVATQKAYEMVGLSYDVIMLPEITPYYIGQLLQVYMVQVLYLAELMSVNPFDQPHVELYKTIMRQLS